MRRRSKILTLLAIGTVIAVLAVVAPLVCCTPFSASILGMGTGDRKYAKTWRDRFAPLSDPEAAQAAYPEAEVKRFPNGEWAFGVCSDSHSSHWGGTLVVKDSTGKTRVFFGHVCGDSALHAMLHDAKTLKDFYRDGMLRKLTEQPAE